jgi:hypothetical protein
MVKEITADNLEQFIPNGEDPSSRTDRAAKAIGVTSKKKLKNFQGAIEEWNRDSAVGFSDEELDIISLILISEENNVRFSGLRFLDPKLGGNTAEHPIFIGHKIDLIRNNAGFGANAYRGEGLRNKENLVAARIAQYLHIYAALHDMGEIVDISYTEQTQIGASKKEPEEEKLIGGFKIRLAAYALSVEDPSIYSTSIKKIKTAVDEAKQRLIKAAEEKIASEQKRLGRPLEDDEKKIIGNQCIDDIGKAIAGAMADVECELQMPPLEEMDDEELKKAAQTLIEYFDQSQMAPAEIKDPKYRFLAALFNAMDKTEGTAHFRHFLGKPQNGHPHPEDAALLERMFNNGGALSLNMATNPGDVILNILYAQKAIPPLFAAVDAMPGDYKKQVAERYARAAAAEIIHDSIKVMQMAPPLIDLDDQRTPSPEREGDEAKQRAVLADQIAAQQTHKNHWLESRKSDSTPCRYGDPDAQGIMPALTGVVDTKYIIATLYRIKEAIEKGEFRPTAANLPMGIGALPAALKPGWAGIASYPLETHAMRKVYKLDGEQLKI